MNIKVLIVNDIAENAYILHENGKALVVDPGDTNGEIIGFLKENNLELEGILLTHGHFDHCFGVEKLRKEYNVKVYGSKQEKIIFESTEYNFSKNYEEPFIVNCDYFFDEECITIGDFNFRTILTNGHSPGSSCFYFEEAKVLFSGDTLFNKSIGRTDFYFGDENALIKNIREKLFVLPDDVKVYSGHGFSSTIGNEKASNPFFRS